MSDILESLFGNLGLIIVIGGIVLSFLSRARSSQRRTGRGPSTGKPNPMMPPFGGGGPERDWRRSTNASPAPGPESENGLPAQSREPLRAESARTEPARQESLRSMSASTVPDGSVVAGDLTRKASGDREPGVRTEDALSGVMWAELLGPPRARKPFGSKNR